MQDSTQPIAVFDSGVGGLSIYEELKRHLPNENFVYLADQKNAPYGGRSPSEIRTLTLNCLNFLISPRLPEFPQSPKTPFLPPKIVVIACNTATTAGIDFYREQFPNIPIIGVVPVVKTAAETTKNNRIAILSTVATAKSDYQKNLIEKFCPNFSIFNLISPDFPNFPDFPKLPPKLLLNIGCPNLVSFIEQGITSGPKIEKELTEILKPVIDAGCDTLVLGCTHYPFLKKTILKVIYNLSSIPYNLQVLDSSGAISRQTKRILGKNNLLSTYPSSTTYISSSIFLTTGNPQNFQQTIQKLIKLKTRVEKILI